MRLPAASAIMALSAGLSPNGMEGRLYAEKIAPRAGCRALVRHSQRSTKCHESEGASACGNQRAGEVNCWRSELGPGERRGDFGLVVGAIYRRHRRSAQILPSKIKGRRGDDVTPGRSQSAGGSLRRPSSPRNMPEHRRGWREACSSFKYATRDSVSPSFGRFGLNRGCSTSVILRRA